MSTPSILRLLLAPLLMVLAVSCARRDQFRVVERSGEIPAVPVSVAVPDFEDLRTNEQQADRGMVQIPLNVYGGFFYIDRHDAIYPTSTEPFPKLVAAEMVKRLEETKAFSAVKYVPAETGVAYGETDLILKGTIHRLRSRGRMHRWGLSILADIPLALGLADQHRRWEIDIEYQLVNGYTNEPIGEPIRSKMITDREWFTKYKPKGPTKDLVKKMKPVIDEFIDHVWTKVPPASDASWAALKEDGARRVAARSREEDEKRRGVPPQFRFSSPANGTQLRAATTAVKWDIFAPGRLKSASLTVNNTPVDLGIPASILDSAEAAPAAIEVRETDVPLRLGANRIEAIVSDHKGNRTTAEIAVTRLPKALVPATRHALLIGTGDEGVGAGLESLKAALTDPLVGQMPAESVTIADLAGASGDGWKKAISDFGARPRANELVLIVVATKGTWADLKLADGAVDLDTLIAETSRQLATNDVVFVFDIDWDSAAGETDLRKKLTQSEPQGWALMTPQATGGRALVRDGRRLFLDHMVKVLKGEPGASGRLTVDRFVDDLLLIEQEAAGSLYPETYGRYTRSNTMAERE